MAEWTWEGTFEVSANDDFIILAPGEYDFTIVNMERVTAEDNLSWVKAGTPGAKLTLRVTDPNSGQEVDLLDTFWMTEKSARKLKGLFGSIGQYKKGDTQLKVSWTNIIGEKGRCEIFNKESNGKTYNNIKRYIYKEDASENNWGAWNG